MNRSRYLASKSETGLVIVLSSIVFAALVAVSMTKLTAARVKISSKSAIIDVLSDDLAAAHESTALEKLARLDAEAMAAQQEARFVADLRRLAEIDDVVGEAGFESVDEMLLHLHTHHVQLLHRDSSLRVCRGWLAHCEGGFWWEDAPGAASKEYVDDD